MHTYLVMVGVCMLLLFILLFVYYRNGSVVFVSSIGGFVPLPVSIWWYSHACVTTSCVSNTYHILQTVRGGIVSQFLWMDWYRETFPAK